jgi:UDP-N-acetyl-D-mannosaminuronate dehydrogenase
MPIEKISVVGIGKLGLCTAAYFASISLTAPNLVIN